MLAHKDRLLNLRLLNSAVFVHLYNAIAVRLRYHLVVLHLLHLVRHPLVVALFEFEDFTGALARFLDLLPRLDLFLLEEGDAIR